MYFYTLINLKITISIFFINFVTYNMFKIIYFKNKNNEQLNKDLNLECSFKLDETYEPQNIR